jgi:tetratricopeptide (TPR) repeat protein
LTTNRGDLKGAAELLEQLRALAQTSIGERDKHRVALHWALARAGAGDRIGAVAKLSEAEDLLPDDRMAALERVSVRSVVDSLTRDFRSAVLHSEMAIDMSREMGLTHEAMLNLHNLGVALVQLDDGSRATHALRQSLALCEEYGYERRGNFNRMLIAYVEGLRSSNDAEKQLAQGIAYAESKDFVWEVVAGGALLAKLLQRHGKLDAARSEYEKARTLASRTGHKMIADECDAALHTLRGTHASAPKPIPRESAS